MTKHKIITALFAFLLTLPAFAQINKTITVKAGTRVQDSFPFSTRYLYSDFIPGRIWWQNGTYSDSKMNYSFLAGEIEFIRGRDTSAIANKKDIKQIVIARDTFYYDKGYIEQLYSGKIIVGRKQLYELKMVQNKDSYGTSGSGSATTSYGSLPADGNFYKLTANKDMIFQGAIRYYIGPAGGSFTIFSRKSLNQILPGKKDQISSFLKQNRINYNSEEDLLKVADFLNKL